MKVCAILIAAVRYDRWMALSAATIVRATSLSAGQNASHLWDSKPANIFKKLSWVALVALTSAISVAPVRADSCNLTASRVASSARGIQQEKTFSNSLGKEIHFRHRSIGSVQIFCNAGLRPVVTIDIRTLYPNEDAFDLIGRIASAETGVSYQSARRSFSKLHQKAVGSLSEGPLSSGEAEVETKNARFQLFVYGGEKPIINFQIQKLQ